MAIQSVVMFAILLLNDYRVFSKFWSLCCRGLSRGPTYNQFDANGHDTLDGGVASARAAAGDDDDVRAEADRIRSAHTGELMQTDVLVLDQVERVYNGTFHAVDKVSVGVKHGECFGLLGVNGA